MIDAVRSFGGHDPHGETLKGKIHTRYYIRCDTLTAILTFVAPHTNPTCGSLERMIRRLKNRTLSDALRLNALHRNVTPRMASALRMGLQALHLFI
jgi:hypothetical protein